MSWPTLEFIHTIWNKTKQDGEIEFKSPVNSLTLSNFLSVEYISVEHVELDENDDMITKIQTKCTKKGPLLDFIKLLKQKNV